MELSDLQTLDDHEEGIKLFLVDKRGREVDAYVIVKGPDSAAYRKAKRKQRQKVLQVVEQGHDIDDFDFFPIDAEFVGTLISDWGEITQDGEPYPFTRENCKELLSKAPAIVDRVLEHCGNRENFIKG